MERAMDLADYHIDGWHLRLPQAWSLSTDEEQRPPQLIFQAEGEPVTLYVSAWSFYRPDTGEAAPAETVRSLMEQALAHEGARPLMGCEDCCPPGYLLCAGRSTTTDGCEMTSCFLCAEGRTLSVCIACGAGADCGRYLPLLRGIRREGPAPGPVYPQDTEK